MENYYILKEDKHMKERLKKIEKAMDWFDAERFDEIDLNDVSYPGAFWIGCKQGFLKILPYYMVVFSIVGCAAWLKK